MENIAIFLGVIKLRRILANPRIMANLVQSNLHKLTHYFEDDDESLYACSPEYLQLTDIQYELRIRYNENHRVNTATIRNCFLRERKGEIMIPAHSCFPPRLDYDQCTFKIKELEEELRNIHPNLDDCGSFKSRYVHLMNRILRINVYGDHELSLRNYELLEGMIAIRERYSEIKTGFTTRNRVHHSIATANDISSSNSMADNNRNENQVSSQENSNTIQPVSITTASNHPITPRVTFAQADSPPSSVRIDVTEIERRRFKQVLDQLSATGNQIQNESMVVNAPTANQSTLENHLPISQQTISTSPSVVNNSYNDSIASMSGNNSNVTSRGNGVAYASVSIQPPNDTNDFRQPLARSSDVNASVLFGQRTHSLSFHPSSQAPNVTNVTGSDQPQNSYPYIEDDLEDLFQMQNRGRMPFIHTTQSHTYNVSNSMPAAPQIPNVIPANTSAPPFHNTGNNPLSDHVPNSVSIIPPVANAAFVSENPQPSQAGDNSLNNFVPISASNMLPVPNNTYVNGHTRPIYDSRFSSRNFNPLFASSAPHFTNTTHARGNNYPIASAPFANAPNQTYTIPPAFHLNSLPQTFHRFRPTFVPINKWGISFSGKFTDNSSNLIVFLKEIEVRQRMYQIPDEVLFANILVLLDGPAKLWYMSHIHEFVNWSELRNALYTKYIGKMQHSFFLAVTNRKQQSGETIGAYFADMILKMSSIPDLNEQRRISIVINGLLPQFRNRVAGFNWNKLSDIEDFLTSVEADLLAQSKESNQFQSRFVRRGQVSAVDTDNSELNTSVDRVSEEVI